MDRTLETRFPVGISNKSLGKEPVIVNCGIDDKLTHVSCSRIVSEIAKHIVYCRLIPYPYCALKSAAQKLNNVSIRLCVYFVYCVTNDLNELLL
jgi:hypothetical protein